MASAPLWVISGLFILLGVLAILSPDGLRDSLARQVKLLYGDNAASRYRRLPENLFRLVGSIAIFTGLALAAFALGTG